uniref:Uncharacterized protein n=1 Tax=Romanomermis culicivorax TaxID=13658 RepID=A0A915HII3_ROMCU
MFKKSPKITGSFYEIAGVYCFVDQSAQPLQGIGELSPQIFEMFVG